MSELKAGTIKTPYREGIAFVVDDTFYDKEEGETLFYLKSEADKVFARHKRKRCLAMANWCFDEGKGTPTVYEVRTFYWGRWGNIWLALAEEPTWERFLQLIHKEAK